MLVSRPLSLFATAMSAFVLILPDVVVRSFHRALILRIVSRLVFQYTMIGARVRVGVSVVVHAFYHERVSVTLFFAGAGV